MRCIFTNNRSFKYGGAIIMKHSLIGIIENSNITNNYAYDLGGGLNIENSQKITT